MDKLEREAWLCRNDGHDTPILDEYMESWERWSNQLKKLQDIAKFILVVILWATVVALLSFFVLSLVRTIL